MNIQSLFPVSASAIALSSAFLLAIAMKSAFVLSAASITSLTLRRASAAVRHLIWLLAVAGVLSLPLLSILVPPVHLLVPVAPTVTPSPPTSIVPALRPPPMPPVAASKYPSQMPPVDAWPLLLFAVWSISALGILIRRGISLAAAAQLTRQCVPVVDITLLREMDCLAKTSGVKRRVHLRHGAAVFVPMTIGFRHPCVLIPDDMDAWPVERRKAAMLHELAHIRRCDWAFQTLTGVACALYWFNPLIWLAARQLRAESEGACDDAVLALGTLPTDYASHLLEIARQLSGTHSAPPGSAVAMARRPQIEGRLRSILRSGLNRHGLTRRFALLALAGCLLALLPVAALRTAAEDQTEAKARAEAYQITSLSNLRQIGLAIIVYAQNHAGCLPDADHWVDEIAPSLARGDEKVLRNLMWDRAAPQAQPYGYAFNRALSAANLATLKDPSHIVMVFESTQGRRNAADTGQSVPVPGRHAGGTHYVFADGRARWVADGEQVSFAAASAPPPAADSSRAADFNAAVFTGRVIYEDGRPAMDVRVGAQIQNDASLKLWEASQGQMMLANGISLPLPASVHRPTADQVRRSSWAEAVTGADGTYRLSGLTAAPYNIAVLPRDPRAINNPSLWVAAAIEGAQGKEEQTRPLPDLVLTAGGLVSGQVTDAAGKPLAGIAVYSYGPHRPASSAMVIGTTTGPDGRYQLRVAPGHSRIYIADEGWTAQEVILGVAKGETKTADFQATPRAIPSRPDTQIYPKK